MRFTEKRDGQNVIPLRNVVCGVDMPKWRIVQVSDNEMYLMGDVADKLAAIEDNDTLPISPTNEIVYVEYNFRNTPYVGIFKLADMFPKHFRLTPVYQWDAHQIEEETGTYYLDVPKDEWVARQRTVTQWIDSLKNEGK